LNAQALCGTLCPQKIDGAMKLTLILLCLALAGCSLADPSSPSSGAYTGGSGVGTTTLISK
jgi:hypothetical protein